MIINTLKKMGIMRQLLIAMALLLVITMPWADVTLPPEGWGLIRSAVLPAAMPIVFMVVMLDVLMCQVLKSDADVQRRRDLNRFIIIYLLVSVLMLASWLPVFLQAQYF